MCVVLYRYVSTHLLRGIMAAMSTVKKIGVMGARGSFSEQAGERYKNEEGLLEAEIVPLV